MRWTEKYRPHRFEDVVGQAQAVGRLRTMVTSKRRGSIILHGPSGAGKTTLAKIYAQAVMCEAPLDSGSPCTECRACLLFEDDRQPHFHEINSALDGSTEDIRTLVEEDLTRRPLSAAAHVIFFDEAHTLTKKAQQALLKPLEVPSPHIAFIFSLIDPEALVPTLRNRCDQFALQPPSHDEARRFLDRICHSELLACEPDALDLIAQLAPSFRQLAQSLEEVATTAPGELVTADQARTVMRRARMGLLLDYLEAVVAGELDKQLQAISAPTLEPASFARQVLELLLHLKLTRIGPTRTKRGNSAMQLLLNDVDCQPLLDGLTARAERHGVELVTLLDEVLEFWTFMPARIDQTVLEAQVVRFHDLMTMDRPPGRDRSETAARIARVTEGAAFRSNAGRRKPPAWRTADAADGLDQGAYLSLRQAEEIYTAATYLAQRYGVTFNARLTLHHKALGLHDEKRAVTLTSDLGKELGQRLGDWLKGTPAEPESALLHRVVLHERLPDGSLVSTILLHLGGAVEARAREWIFHKFLPGSQLGANGWREDWLEIWHPKSAKGALAQQWELVRRLWRGLDPSIEAGGVPLIDRLKVPKDWRQPAGDVSHRRFSVSQSLSKASRAEQAPGLPPFRSLFAEGAWEYLFGGWELKAFDIRQTELRRFHSIQGDLLREQEIATDSLSMRQLAFQEAQALDDCKNIIQNQIHSIIKQSD